ncbi:hypothetical protein [Arenimonas sp.]|uniref:hypothetical protein n=1 Tax=Arenimonas sp. TaxID=1872635 RepID=UPI002D8024D7|nr:hypothetical protein [Arenimonas sp.]
MVKVMSSSLPSAVALVCLGLAAIAPSPGQAKRVEAPAQAATASSLSPARRDALARDFVRKWGPYVEEVYGVSAQAWAERMGSTFAHADPDNLREALRRTTYEGASAVLSGTGSRLSDEQVIDSMARAKLAPVALSADDVTLALGSAASDLVYTPVTPCRILDTRVSGGAIAGTFSRDFNAVVGAGGNFSSQGGSATDCGMVAAGQAAVVVNLTVVTPAGAGFATAYPFGTARPLASSVNYTAGSIVNNSIVVKLPSPLTSQDFSVYTFATADFVADVVGYYAAPMATALQCTRQFGNFVSVPANTYGFGVSATCPSGYTATGLGIEAAANVVMADSAINSSGGTIFTYNLGGTAQSTRAWAQCCRVPGR